MKEGHPEVFDDCQKSLSDGPSMGLYVHFPYCRQRCSYCDFNAHLTPTNSDQAFADYHRALLADIAAQPKARIRTIFWGGGTPSLMPVPYLREVMHALDARFEWTPDLENTLEVNPGTLSESGFRTLREHGWNRLSLGAQAFQPELLELVGRVHTASDIETTYGQARRAGFDNLSLDLIYGFPTQTMKQWEETLERSLALEPEHLSIYHLTIEPSTRLERQIASGELRLPDDDIRAEMDDRAIAVMTEAGFQRYEVSNWARSGRESKHNLLYWTDASYLGVGCGAASYHDHWRTYRIQPPAYYQKALAQGRSPVNFAERRSSDGALKDILMMGLRIAEGVSSSDLYRRFPGLQPGQLEAFFQGLPEDWWRLSEGRFQLTRAGWDFHSEVTMQMLDVVFSFS